MPRNLTYHPCLMLHLKFCLCSSHFIRSKEERPCTRVGTLPAQLNPSAGTHIHQGAALCKQAAAKSPQHVLTYHALTAMFSVHCLTAELSSLSGLVCVVVQVGQLSSTRSDLFPAEFIEELSELQVCGHWTHTCVCRSP